MIFTWASQISRNLLQMQLDAERAAQADVTESVEPTEASKPFSMTGLFEIIPQSEFSPRSFPLFPRRR